MTRKLGSLDSIDDVVQYYQSNQEEQRSSIQQLEFTITQNLLTEYLSPRSNLLEVGAGAGHYTSFLAEAGHHVSVIELVPELNLQNQNQIQQKKLTDRVEFFTGDARVLADQIKEQFDGILLMGPLYHLTEAQDRKHLMKKMSALLKPGGVMITTHLSRVGLIGYMLTRFPTWGADSPQEADEILRLGYLPNHPRNGQFRGYFTTVDEIHTSHTEQGLQVLQIHSQDPCLGSVDELYNRLSPDLKQHWTKILLKVSADPLALGSGRSLFCVSQKK